MRFAVQDQHSKIPSEPVPEGNGRTLSSYLHDKLRLGESQFQANPRKNFRGLILIIKLGILYISVACHHSSCGSVNRRTIVQAGPDQKERLYFQNNQRRKGWRLAQESSCHARTKP
jgi:hypothetical protein